MIRDYSKHLKNSGLIIGASILVAFLLVALLTFPSKKNQLEFIEEEIQKVQEHKKILTEKEKELEKLATEKDWEEVDKDTNK
jgi:flagellar biosynthesis/type III secretory pathway M-ring protein FliF/YscJ